MAETPLVDLLTSGEIANRLGVSRIHIRYAILKSEVRPVRRVGLIRMFSEHDIPKIEAAVKTIRPQKRRWDDPTYPAGEPVDNL